MAYASAASSASPKGVLIKISVIGRNGYALKKSKITFYVSGRAVGTIDDSNGFGSILLPDADDRVTVEAKFGESTVQRILKDGEEEITIQLDEDELLLKALLPTRAICPDGTSGQPCVVCSIGGKPYQICA